MDVRVDGEPEQDKHLTILLNLHALNTDTESASSAYMRIASDIGTFFDLHLGPIDTEGARVKSSTRLKGTYTLSKFAKAGYWYPVGVTVKDDAGNSRYQSLNTFKMKIYLNNPKEDYFEPKYVENSIDINVREESRTVFNIERDIQVINVSWSVDENNRLRDSWPCYVRLYVDIENTDSFDEYGHAEGDRCSVDFPMPHYMPTGNFSVRYVLMADMARNKGYHVFLSDAAEAVPTIRLITANPDSTPPELDVNRIFVDAEPTNPDNPDGETLVVLTYHIRDDISGLFDTGVTIRDPQGGKRFRWHMVPDRGSLFSRAQPNEWQKLVMNWTLPPGSPPGTWGISSMYVRDKASNEKFHNFNELIHVDVQNDSTVMQVE